MKGFARGLAALALTFALTGVASAWGGSSCSGPNCNSPEAAYQSRYGLHPFLRKLFHIRRVPAMPVMPAPAAPPATGGTLVFPNHPFARSPRDYFMVGDP